MACHRIRVDKFCDSAGSVSYTSYCRGNNAADLKTSDSSSTAM